MTSHDGAKQNIFFLTRTFEPELIDFHERKLDQVSNYDVRNNFFLHFLSINFWYMNINVFYNIKKLLAGTFFFKGHRARQMFTKL